jgi:HD-GYP domain-containing protein (c-di-GMP phosphodiesterase class II)
MSKEKCLEIIAADRGKHFDPKVHDALLARLPELMEVYGQPRSNLAA